MLTLGMVVLVLGLLLLRQNIIVILGMTLVVVHLVLGDGNLPDIVLDAWNGLNNEVLISIPLFILAGNLMSEGSTARRLIRLMRALTAPVPGGLALAAVLSCAFFAAISGSSTVTMLAVGSVMFPALVESGYSRSFAVGALCTAGTLGILVPPSIPLILYGIVTGTSIPDLFLAGLGPALLLTLVLSVYVMAVNFHIRSGKLDLREVIQALRSGTLAILAPVIILGGIYSGYFTVTESAAVAVLYVSLVEFLAHRDMNFEKLYKTILRTGSMLGVLFPVFMLAQALNIFLAYEHVPEALVGIVQQYATGDIGFVLVTNLFLLLIGCIMDIGSAVLILAPMLQPMAEAQGMHALHFGAMMIFNLEIGYLTPPLGLNVIVAVSAFGMEFWAICRAVLPFLGLMLFCLVLVALIPGIAMLFVG